MRIVSRTEHTVTHRVIFVSVTALPTIWYQSHFKMTTASRFEYFFGAIEQETLIGPGNSVVQVREALMIANFSSSVFVLVSYIMNITGFLECLFLLSLTKLDAIA